MGFLILGQNGGATTAESTDDGPICRYCAWLTVEQVIIGRRRFEEPICQRHIPGWRTARKCDLFMRATGADDE
jgi:hypothetical protein